MATVGKTEKRGVWRDATGEETKETVDFLLLCCPSCDGAAQVEDDVIYFTDKAEKQQAYSTVVFNDPDLVDRLYNSGCKFGKIQDEKDSWVSQFILFVLQIAVFVAIGQMLSRMLMKKMGGGGLGNAMQFGKSNAKVYVASETGIKFHDVAGEDEAKEQLQELARAVFRVRVPWAFSQVTFSVPYS